LQLGPNRSYIGGSSKRSEITGRSPVRDFFCAKNLVVPRLKPETAEGAKKGVDGENGGPYKPPLPDGAAGFGRASELRFQLFDIVRD
jgi:hypothetical protein